MNPIRDDLKAFLDGELPESRRAEVQAAIEADPKLLQEVEEMKLIGIEIRRIATEPTVIGRAEAMEAVRRGGRRSPLEWYRSLHPAAATLLAVTILGGVALVTAPLFGPGAPMVATGSESVQPNAKAESEAPADMLSRSPMEGAELYAKGRVQNGFGGVGGAGAPGRERPATSMPEENKQGISTESMSRSLPNRMIVKHGDISIRVESVRKTLQSVRSLVASSGGFIESSSSGGGPNNSATANMTLRVPSNQFESIFGKLIGLGELVNESSNGDDVTAQYADTTARLKVMKAEEDSLVTMLRAARRVAEMLEIKERLFRIRAEIDGLEAAAKALKDHATLSTITLNLEEKVKVAGSTERADPFGEAWASAVNGLQAALQFLGRVAITLFVYSPLWLPLAFLGWRASRQARKVA